jgi:molecular chaperone Hsp33
LVDRELSPDRLLFRLFHEDGVRLYPPSTLRAACRCSEDRVLSLLKSFAPEDVTDMIEPDGRVHVTCEYCARHYVISVDAIG